jgi:hypothetical protein
MTVTVLDPIDDVDEKFLENMVTYGKSVTGIDNVIFISPAHGQRGPRSKSQSTRRSGRGLEAG